MKKKLILLCVLAMLVMGLAVNAHAAGATISMDTVSAAAGAEVSVPVKITGNPGFTDFVMSLNYDTSKLTATGVTAGLINPTGGNANNATGTQVSVANAANVTGDGTLFTIKFKVADGVAGDIDITVVIQNPGVGNEDGDTVDTTATAGKVTVAAHTHTMTKTAGKAATCIAAGVKDTWTCSGCGKTFIDEAGTTEANDTNKVIPINTANHTKLTETKAKAPTCQAAGNNAYWTCEGCHKVYKADKTTETSVAAETLAKGTHSGTVVAEVPATCTAEGTKAHYKCDGCGKTFLANTQTEATADDLVIAKAAHTLTETPATAATCTAEGNNAYWTCGTCNKVFKDAAGTQETTVKAETLAKIAHTKEAGKGQAYKAATTSAEGALEVFYCDTCSKWYKGDASNSGAYTELTADEIAKAEANDFSGFTIAKKTETTKPSTKPGDKKAPKTGDETNIALWVVLFALCATVVTVIATKKLRKN